MATGYGVCVHIVYEHREISSTGPRGQPGVNPYKDCVQIVRKSCSCRAVSAASARKSYGGGSALAPCGALCIATYDMSTGYGLTIFFKFVKLLAKPNRRGRGARESVRKSHSHRLPPQGGLAEAARKGGYGQDTGSVYPSQAKCELGIYYIKPHDVLPSAWWVKVRRVGQVQCHKQHVLWDYCWRYHITIHMTLSLYTCT